MAWSWSHTQEAYDNARTNLGGLPFEVKREIWAEWLARDPLADDADYSGFSQSLFVSAMEATVVMADDVLAELIWDQASEQATCDNGGFQAWLCPYGCGPHCVPFDREDADNA